MEITSLDLNLLATLEHIRLLDLATRVEMLFGGYNQDNTKFQAKFVFNNCKEIRITYHDPALKRTEEMIFEDDLAGMILGKENHLAPAIVTGFSIEVFILYGTYTFTHMII